MRMSRLTAATAALFISIVISVPVHAATPAAPAAKPAAKPVASPIFEKATFAGGCFWSMETAFEGLPGVQSVISGYSGGKKANPTYEDVSSGLTGHLESVQITYDPKKITYADLVDNFWHNIDPTQADGQLYDIASEYHTAIFVADPEQKRLAEDSKRKLETTPQRFKGRIATQILPFTGFWPAEDYHQDYYQKNPEHYQAYRKGSGRDQRLTELWGQPGRQGHAGAESAAAH
jgi:peptide-methionine (S)-S-oxide reductase